MPSRCMDALEVLEKGSGKEDGPNGSMNIEACTPGPLVAAPLAIFGALLPVRSRRLQAALLGTAFMLELMNGRSTGL